MRATIAASPRELSPRPCPGPSAAIIDAEEARHAGYPRRAMPIYEYRCRNGHTFEVFQRMADDPIRTCEVCGAPVERVFHPVAVHFKGSGFYTTDYARKGAKTSADGAGKDSADGKESSSEKKPAEKKSEKTASGG